MAKNLNPLDELQDYTIDHIIAAYEFTQDACLADSQLEPSIGPPGTSFSGKACGGKAYVLVNSTKSADISVVSAKTKWDFFSPLSEKTTSYTGTIILSDTSEQAGSGWLSDAMHKYAKEMEVAIQYWAVAWKTIFRGRNKDGVPQKIEVNPLVFHITRFTQSFDESASRLYMMEIAAAYNTSAYISKFINTTQCTLTDKSGGLHNSSPDTSGSSGGILPRRIEDGIKESPREARLNKSKPMKTLDDIFKSMEVELIEQKYTHKNQVQKLMKIIKPEFVDIINPVEQIGNITVRHQFKLDPQYASYKIDNRNLPFEQPEQDQSQPGIRTITFPQGYNTIQVADRLMKLSRKTGDDHAQPIPKSYKINCVQLRKCAGSLTITTKVDKHTPAYIVPNGANTGPGEGLASGPIELEYRKPGVDASDIYSMAMSGTSEYKVQNLEKNSKQPDSLAVYAEKEQPTIERYPQGNFFMKGFTGFRMFCKGLLSIIGLESTEDAAKIHNFTPFQQNRYLMNIRGNPHLLNDINRSPMDVADGSETWKGIIYTKPEIYPMHLKLTMHMQSDTYSGMEVGNAKPTFYFSDYVHIASITNAFDAGGLTQTLECVRNDDQL